MYQAYTPAIGHFAAAHKYFGDQFSFSRMSWIKTNFLWLMYRSQWGTKKGQEVTLAIWLKRSAFDVLLRQAVISQFDPQIYPSKAVWKQAVVQSQVRLQWDPDHDPSGAAVPRRAIQLGLRGEMLVRYSREWIVHIEDISDLVSSQRQAAQIGEYARLVIPREVLYPINAPTIAMRLGMPVTVPA